MVVWEVVFPNPYEKNPIRVQDPAAGSAFRCSGMIIMIVLKRYEQLKPASECESAAFLNLYGRTHITDKPLQGHCRSYCRPVPGPLGA